MMGQLIDDLLSFSRLGRKNDHVRAGYGCLIRDTWDERQILNPDKLMSFEIHPMPLSVGDRTLIKQVFNNLLSNAVNLQRSGIPVLIEVGGYAER